MAEIAAEPRQRPTIATRREVREAYIKGKGTLRALARQFSVSFWTIQDWAKAERWTELRASFDEASRDRLMAQTLPVPVPIHPAPTDDATQSGKLARIEKQLTRVYELLETCDAREIKALVEAEQRLLNCWALLTGFPKPGTRKPSRRTGPNQPSVEPVEPVPV